jgi:putative transposase
MIDALVVKVRHEKQVIKKHLYLALAINVEGDKELLGMWLADNEGAKFWLSVMNERTEVSGTCSSPVWTD